MRAPCHDHGQGIGKVVYGNTTVRGVSVKLHRVAYANYHGIDVHNMGGVVLHDCDNPRCIEPTHLTLGTYQTNSDDMVAKGRHKALKGEASPTAILTLAQVREIRSRYIPRCRVNGCRAMGREFGVDNHTISDIITNKRWRDTI